MVRRVKQRLHTQETVTGSVDMVRNDAIINMLLTFTRLLCHSTLHEHARGMWQFWQNDVSKK
jgi:hypothetical protein